MKTKLTLRLDEEVIARAKAYAAARGTSLSALAENYFRLVSPDASPGGDGAPPSTDSHNLHDGLGPRVRALLDRPLPTRDVTEEDYKRYLEEKHR